MKRPISKNPAKAPLATNDSGPTPDGTTRFVLSEHKQPVILPNNIKNAI